MWKFWEGTGPHQRNNQYMVNSNDKLSRSCMALTRVSYQTTSWDPSQVFKQHLSLPPVSHFLIFLSTYLLSSRQKLQVPNSLCKILLGPCGQACGVFLENLSIRSVLEVNVMTIRIVLVKSATLMENEREGDEAQMRSRISES